jgi:hypothetical protein
MPFFSGSTLRPESSDLFLKIVSVSVRVANLTIPTTSRSSRYSSTKFSRQGGRYFCDLVLNLVLTDF